MRRMAVTLVLLSLGLTACGHKDYDDFMNNFDTDVLGVLALVVMVVSGVLFVAVNRRNETTCPHAAEPAMCLRPRCRNGVMNFVELTAVSVFILTMGAGLGFLNDPEGWLEMTRPLI